MFFLTVPITLVSHPLGLGQETQAHTQHTKCCRKCTVFQSVGPHDAFNPCCTDRWQLPELWQWEMFDSDEHQITTPRTSGHSTGAPEKSRKTNAH